jgi:hypothetical protein
MYTQESTVEIQSTTNWNQIGHSMTCPANRVIAQQYSSATFISLRFHFCKETFGARFKNVTISILFLLM